jgi:glutathione S-transferase
MLRLWYGRGSIALAAHIALEETGATYEARALDFRAGEQTGAEYRALNPKGRVPTLDTPQGVLTEAIAVLSWIAATHPEAGLEPQEPFARAQLLSFQSYLASTVHVAHAHGPRASRWADDPAAQAAMKAKVPQTMAECMALIEDHLFAGPWVMGTRYTTCDPYLFTICRWLPADGVRLADHPRLAAHFEAMLDRPAVVRALAHHA